jgi:hypothetical protein
VRRALELATPSQRLRLNAFAHLFKPVWLPNPGPQTLAYDCEADITGYGGAAGGGKSQLVTGLAMTAHRRALIIRQEKVSTRKFVQDIAKAKGDRDGYSSQGSTWAFTGPDGVGRMIEFAGMENEGDEEKQQGVDYDLKAYDEVTQMRERQVRYTIGWARTDIPGQRVRVLMTFNPPTTAEGRWIIKFFGPWLDPKHHNPAKDGELRWFTTIGDNEDYEVDGPEPFVIREDGSFDYAFDPDEFTGEKAIEIIKPMSRTFITARVTDNPYYMQSGYIRQLQALPEPLRSQMLRGDFTAGVEDPAWQVIPTAWIEAAQERWRPRDAKGVMDSLGVDAARGGNMGSSLGATGKDKMVISRRHGTWFDKLLSIKGVDVNDGYLAAAQVIRFRKDDAPVHLDVIGIGTSPYDVLTNTHVQTIAINGAAKSLGVDASGLLAFVNLRAELHWRMREALDPKNPDPIALPPDPELLADLAAPTYKLVPGGIQVESKEDLKKRIKRSPDKGDAVIYALVTTPKVKYERTGYLDPGAAALEGDYEQSRFNALKE